MPIRAPNNKSSSPSLLEDHGKSLESLVILEDCLEAVVTEFHLSSFELRQMEFLLLNFSFASLALFRRDLGVSAIHQHFAPFASFPEY